MNDLIKKSIVFMSCFWALGLVSCTSHLPSKAGDFDYFNPDFEFDEAFGLRVDGVYVNVMGPYTKRLSPDEFDRKFNGDLAQVNKREVPKEDSLVTYTAYEILIFCKQDGAYFHAYGTNFDAGKMRYYEKFSKEEICGKRYGNFYYRFNGDKVDLEHVEYWQYSRVKIKEEARLRSGTLLLKKASSDWSRKRTETPFEFHPFAH